MGYWKRNAKRLLIDMAGILLILAAALIGWLPGPGGIPLALAGLGLLSINNQWAHDLREYLLKHGHNVLPVLFPETRWVTWLYDAMVLLLLALSSVLVWLHAAVWQTSLAVVGYFFALTIVLLNRDRAGVQRRKRRKSANETLQP